MGRFVTSDQASGGQHDGFQQVTGGTDRADLRQVRAVITAEIANGVAGGASRLRTAKDLLPADDIAIGRDALASGGDSLAIGGQATGLASTAIDGVALYAATTRGLEESGTAPSFAANANLTLPALRTRQVEAGVRWTLAKDIKLIAGVFDVRRPYFELDADNFFRVLGDVKHQGVELSLTAKPVAGLNVVAGAVLMRPRVTGDYDAWTPGG